MSSDHDRISAALARMAAAQAAIYATGEEKFPAGRGGRVPSPSEAYQKAALERHHADQARNRLFVELVGDAETVPMELADRMGLDGRTAASIIHTARNGPRRLRDWLLGESPDDDDPVVWTSETPVE